MRIRLTIIIMLLSTLAPGQEDAKLQQALDTCSGPGEKAVVLNRFSKELLQNNNFGQSILYAKQGLDFARQAEDTKEELSSLMLLGGLYRYVGNYKEALDHNLQALELADKSDLAQERAIIYNNLGIVYFYQGQYRKAIEYYQRYLETSREMDDTLAIGRALSNLGQSFQGLKDYKQALEYYQNSLALKEQLGDTIGMIYTLGNIGGLFHQQDDFTTAIEFYQKAQQLAGNTGNQYISLAGTVSIGMAFSGKGDYRKALTYLLPGADLAKQLNAKQWLADAYKWTAYNYNALGEYAQAYEYHTLYAEVRDSLLNEQSARAITEMQTKYETEQKEKENTMLRQEGLIKDLTLVQQKSSIRQQRLIIGGSIIGVLLLIGLAVMLIRANRIKQAANAALEEQRDEIASQKEEITDSIRYAHVIQEAVLPPHQLMRELFPDAFVLWMPKDIVSGDFYWFGEKDGRRMIAAVDCTGHGVPGAFMSMLGIAYLHEIIMGQSVTQPARVLDEMKKYVVAAMRQSGATGQGKDGMDMALLSFHGNTVEFAGAYNPLYHFRGSELTEIRPDKMPVGYLKERDNPFTNHSIEVQKGDRLYIFSDGFADQFGGPKGKRYKAVGFKQLLTSLDGMPMIEQEQQLVTMFNDWKGDLDQLDDVCVIGIRV